MLFERKVLLWNLSSACIKAGLRVRPVYVNEIDV